MNFAKLDETLGMNFAQGETLQNHNVLHIPSKIIQSLSVFFPKQNSASNF